MSASTTTVSPATAPVQHVADAKAAASKKAATKKAAPVATKKAATKPAEAPKHTIKELVAKLHAEKIQRNKKGIRAMLRRLDANWKNSKDAKAAAKKSK